ncbi:MAG: alpha/beta hydrolase [Desulfobacterales bacterium]|nr:alpha/beta hydrolase [Desulfobacterales bacterium]
MESIQFKLFVLAMAIGFVILVIKWKRLGIGSWSFDTLKFKYAQNSKFINILGTSVHYRDEGNGPVLILLHGVVSSLHTWDEWVKELSPYYRIIRFDVPGFGLTDPKDTKKFADNYWEDFLDAFVSTLGIDKFYIAGNSLGSFISWNYALKYPEKIKKMVLLDPIAFSQPVPWVLKIAKIPVINFFAKYIVPRFLIEKNILEVYGDKTKVTEKIVDRYYEITMRAGIKKSIIYIFKNIISISLSSDIGSKVKDIKVPVLILWGNDDAWVPVSLLQYWREALPSAHYIVYDGVGHVPMEEVPVQSARDVHQYLSEEID